jgi:hypothetical protein
LKKGAFDIGPFVGHVLVFCFNGADHVGVTRKFNDLCALHAVKGVSVFLPSSAVEQWELSLIAKENEDLAKKLTTKIEKMATKADQSLLALVKLLLQLNAPDAQWQETALMTKKKAIAKVVRKFGEDSLSLTN